MRIIDAHNHLQDARLDSRRGEITAGLERMPVHTAVVNGTSEADWEAVSALAGQFPWVRPSFGLHPWHLAGRTPDWLEKLVRQLDAHPRASLGEFGLDRWVEGHDLDLQLEIFRVQLALAVERNLPATIHCLKAWGALAEALEEFPPPKRGFLLHSFGGSAEMGARLASLGAYFSFSPYFLAPGKEKQRDVFRGLPLDRLLAETDAPDMAPPAEQNRHQLGSDEAGKPINHPANILLSYSGLAEIRGMEVAVLGDQVTKNFTRLFGE